MELKTGDIIWQIYSGEIIQSKIKDVKYDLDGSFYFKICSPEGYGSTHWLPEHLIGQIIFNSYKEAKSIFGLTEYEKIQKVYAIANNAIYFNDSSDYLTALYEICNTIKPCKDEYNSLHGKEYIDE